MKKLLLILLLLVPLSGIAEWGRYYNVPDDRSWKDAPSKLEHYFTHAIKPPLHQARLYVYRPTQKITEERALNLFINPADSDTEPLRLAELYAGTYSAILLTPGSYDISIGPQDDFIDQNVRVHKTITVLPGHNYYMAISNKIVIEHFAKDVSQDSAGVYPKGIFHTRYREAELQQF